MERSHGTSNSDEKIIRHLTNDVETVNISGGKSYTIDEKIDQACECLVVIDEILESPIIKEILSEN